MKESRAILGAARINLIVLLALWAPRVLAQPFDVTAYDVYKGRRFLQTGEVPTPVPDKPWVFKAELTPFQAASISALYLVPPGGRGVDLSMNPSGRWSFTGAEASAEALAALYGVGENTFHYSGQIDGDATVSVSTGPDNFPEPPRVLNIDHLLQLDSDDLIFVNWAPVAQGTAQDVIQLRILAPDGSVAFASPGPGDRDALNGTATSAEIPPNSLFQSVDFTATLTFYRIVEADDAEIPKHHAGFFAETGFSIATSSSVSNSIPELLSIVPANHAVSASTLASVPVVFQFGDQMVPGHSIRWSTNLDPKGFLYEWSDHSTRLSCYYTNDWPPNATITWILNPVAGDPDNFFDSEGDELPVGLYSGTFTTGLSMPRIRKIQRINSELQLDIQCMANRPLSLLTSGDLIRWTQLLTTNVPGSSLSLRVKPGASPMFFRAGQD